MPENFDSYIQRLKELEQAENKAALFSFCSLNESVLSYFKGVWEPLQLLINSSSGIDIGIISDVKKVLPELTDIQFRYNKLQSEANSHCKALIESFQDRIDSLNINNVQSVLRDLTDLEQKNSVVPKPIKENPPKKVAKPKIKEKTLSFKCINSSENNDNFLVIYNGINLGSPPCKTVIMPPLSGNSDVIEIIYLPKRVKVKWKLERGYDGVLYLATRHGLLSGIGMMAPVRLATRMFGDYVYIIPCGPGDKF